MKMKIQKLNTAVLLGVMVATAMTSFGINAAEIKDQAKNGQIIESSVVETNTLNMEAYIKGLTMLTEREKDYIRYPLEVLCFIKVGESLFSRKVASFLAEKRLLF